jgi:2-haloacid dehalogenase
MATDRWITFDCFGTLINWHAGFRTLLTPIAGDRTAKLIDTYHEFKRVLEAERPHHRYRDVLTTGLDRAARHIDLALPLAEADGLARRWGELPLYDDVPAALSALRAAGFNIGILTNCDDDLFARTVERFPVLGPALVITAEQVRSYKPDVGHFRHFQAKTGISQRGWVHAACSWFHDIEPMRRIGCARVWVDRDHTGDDPSAASRVLLDLAELPAVAADLGGGPALRRQRDRGRPARIPSRSNVA